MTLAQVVIMNLRIPACNHYQSLFLYSLDVAHPGPAILNHVGVFLKTEIRLSVAMVVSAGVVL